MKRPITIFTALLFAVILWGYFLYKAYDSSKKVAPFLYEVECVAVPDFYRDIIGYDSLQMIYSNGKWEVNFCYPNQWVANKFKLKKDTIVTGQFRFRIEDTLGIKITNHNGDILSGEAVKNVYNK